MSNPFAGLETACPPLQAVRRFLRHAGRLDTLKHAAQVNAVARKLARRVFAFPPLPLGEGLGVRGNSIDLACTAHDMAAVVPLRHILEVAEQFNVPLTAADRAIPQVVHGPVAAAVLEQMLGVTDEDVLNAVRHHTTLRAHASPLEQLVFIADKIAHDPTARHTGFHPTLLAAQNTATLPQLCHIYLDWAVREGPRLGLAIAPELSGGVGIWCGLTIIPLRRNVLSKS